MEKLSQQFSHYGIKTATQNFTEELIIGLGDLGTVYIGRLNSGSIVAIRKTDQGITEFWRDFNLLGQLQDDNVISLKGYCKESTEMVLVYEHMSKGTLKKHLHKLRDNQQARLSWEQLLNICTCAARGVDFLHRVIEPGIIHRKVAGIHGYIDPEYIFMDKVDKESDVYCIGVLLVAVLSGTKAHIKVAGHENLRFQTLKCMEEGKLHKLIDPYLSGNIKSNSLEQFVKLAMQCLREQCKHRPKMDEVVAGLELALEFQLDSSLPLEVMYRSLDFFTFLTSVSVDQTDDEYVNV